MHYYSSADESFLGPPLIFCAPHFNFMELKWGAKKKSGGPKKKFFRRFAPEMPPTFNLLPTPLRQVMEECGLAAAASRTICPERRPRNLYNWCAAP